MSSVEGAARVTVPALRGRKGGQRLACVTAYDAPTGALVDAAGVDVVLVGDSLGNVVLGYESTLPVTMGEMLHHVRAVARGVTRALLVADMPFMSYQPGPGVGLRNAGRFLRAGAAAVKLEGGREVGDTVAALAAHGIPVMGHLGLTPQRVNEFGGYRAQGKDAAAAHRIFRDARLLDRLGVFALVLECVPDALAKRITAACACPTIGIGAGPSCDGQILVFHDLAGLTPQPPRFAKAFARGREVLAGAVDAYVREVRDGSFPTVGSAPALPAAEEAELEARIAGTGEKS